MSDGLPASAEMSTTYVGKLSFRTGKYTPDGLPKNFDRRSDLSYKMHAVATDGDGATEQRTGTTSYKFKSEGTIAVGSCVLQVIHGEADITNNAGRRSHRFQLYFPELKIIASAPRCRARRGQPQHGFVRDQARKLARLAANRVSITGGRDKTTRRANHFRFSEIVSSPAIKNISLYQKSRLGLYPLIPSRPEGRSRSSRTWGGDAVDADSACDDGARRVRQRRVVLTSRCWRQRTWMAIAFQGATEAKSPARRGDHVISRKAIAQGMSDVLRCPVCSCAHFLCTLRMRPRVQRASGIPCALWI